MKKKRIASIDYGMKRIGLAISDENQIIASSLGIIHAQKTSSLTIKEIVNRLSMYDLEKIIVGYPIHLNGNTSNLSDEVEDFTSLLQEEVSCTVVLWDERLSSVQAEKLLKEGGMNRRKRKDVIDAVTAVILLQSFIG